MKYLKTIFLAAIIFLVGCPTSKNTAPTAKDQEIEIKQEIDTDITLEATDAEGDNLTFTVITAPKEGKIAGTAPSLNYKPKDGFVGNDSFTFRANDGRDDSNIATVSITVLDSLESNDTPIQAKALSLSETKRSFINTRDDIDWYSFELEKEVKVAITLLSALNI